MVVEDTNVLVNRLDVSIQGDELRANSHYQCVCIDQRSGWVPRCWVALRWSWGRWIARHFKRSRKF